MADHIKAAKDSAAAAMSSILSPEEIEKLQTEVENEVRAAERKAERERVKGLLLAKRRQAVGLDEPHEDIVVDLAQFADRITLDNVVYMQGKTYTVRAAQAASMREIMERTWRHQAEIDGKSENFYRRARGVRVTPHGNITTSTGIMRV